VSPERPVGFPVTGAQAALVLWAVAVFFSTAAAEILLGAALLLVLVQRLTGRAADGAWWRGGPTTAAAPPLWIAFILLYLVSALTAVDPGVGAAKIPKLYRFALFFVALAASFDEGAWRWFFRALALAAVALAVQAGLVLAAGWSRAATPHLHYNTLAQVVGMISLLLAAAAVYGPRSARPERIALGLGSLLAFAVLAATLSRAAWLGWLTGVGLVMALRLPKRLLVALLLLAVVVPVALVPSVRERAAAIADVRDPEFSRRFDMWRMGRDIVADHPWTGLGPGCIDAVYDDYKTGVLVDDPERWPHVHNDLIEVALSHGLPAAAVWAALALLLYVSLARRLALGGDLPRSWTRAGYVGAGASLHLFYVCGLLHDNYVIYVKICLLLLLWGLFVAADRGLGSRATAGEEAA